jgi:hypothetical protein
MVQAQVWPSAVLAQLLGRGERRIGQVSLLQRQTEAQRLQSALFILMA